VQAENYTQDRFSSSYIAFCLAVIMVVYQLSV